MEQFSEPPKKIAFCFLIYDSINHEKLWYDFFNTMDSNKYSIYIHYKENKPLEYLEKYKLDNCIPTKYGDVSLVNAHNLLFKKALEDPLNYKFINVSQACIPLKKSSYIYNYLTKDNMGHFNLSNKVNKSSEWFILNRKLAELVTSIDINIINNTYSNVFAPEELFFITTINNNKLDNEIITTPNLSNGATTFTNWGDMDYKYSSIGESPQPKNYKTISNEEADYLLNSPCLFGRKFNKECDLNYINNKLNNILNDNISYTQ